MKKEEAFSYYMNNIVFKSWTWGKLTNEEKTRFIIVAEGATLFGNAKQRCEQLNAIYTAFLFGLDYSPLGWREDEKGE